MSASTKHWTKRESATSSAPIPGGKHRGFSDTEITKAYAAIRGFLDKQTIIRQPTN
jgi:hypothetical protein